MPRYMEFFNILKHTFASIAPHTISSPEPAHVLGQRWPHVHELPRGLASLVLTKRNAASGNDNTTVVISPRARVQCFLARYLASLGEYSLKVRFYEEESAGFTKRIS